MSRHVLAGERAARDGSTKERGEFAPTITAKQVDLGEVFSIAEVSSHLRVVAVPLPRGFGFVERLSEIPTCIHAIEMALPGPQPRLLISGREDESAAEVHLIGELIVPSG